MVPWYKERWPWILMSGPAAVVVAGSATLWIAFAGADGLVADDYYKRGLAVNAVLEREQAAARLGLAADLEHSGSVVRVRLRGASPEFLLVRFVNATRAGMDVRLRLGRTASGLYEAPGVSLAQGHWRAIIEDGRGDWRIVKDVL